MRAAVLTAPRSVELRAAPPRELPEGHVRVAVEGCGVCGSNLPVWEGRPWFDYPRPAGSPGHEAWGQVVEGPGVGTRVAVLADDAFADELVVPAGHTVALPAALADQPFPGEALGCAMNVLRRSDVRPGHTVAVVGVGFLGGLLVALCAQAGADVIALARKPAALELAASLGAAHTVRLDDHQRVIDEVGRLTGGALCERVVEVTGAPWPLDLAGELTGVGGRLVIAGFHQDGLRSVNVQLWNWRGLDVVNAHERDPRVQLRGIREAVEAVAAGRLDPRPLYTHVFGLDRLGAAMEAAATRPDGFVKALVTR